MAEEVALDHRRGGSEAIETKDVAEAGEVLRAPAGSDDEGGEGVLDEVLVCGSGEF
jgi:hypothetical protein